MNTRQPSQNTTAPAPALEIRGLAKSFGGVRALHGVGLTVAAGTVHCVLGENGAGKSTLCHLVAGSLTPDTGSLRLYGQPYAPRRPADALAAGIAMVHQHFSLVPTLTVRENLRLLRLPGLAGRLERVEEEYGLALDLDARVSALPVGLRQRVEIVKALLREPRLLLLDEPTGVLDPAAVDALLTTCRRIADRGGAVVLVTHKLGEVAGAGDEATVLRGGTVAGGGPLAQLPPERLVPMMIGRSVRELDPALSGTLGVATDPSGPGASVPPPASPPAPPSGEPSGGPAAPALDVQDVTVRRSDGTYALDGVSLTVAPGEIVGVAGVEGNGQSELMAVLGGSLAPDTGRVVVGTADVTRSAPARRTAAGLGIVPEDRHREGCVGEMSVAENLFLGRLGDFRRARLFLDRAALRRAADTVLTEHGIRADGPDTPVAALSGGNQQKVVLARELALDPLVCLAAAQPTRGLDVGAVDAVHTRVREAAARGAGVVLVSSELDELLTLCHRVVVAYRGRLSGPVTTGTAHARERIGRLMLGTDGTDGTALAEVPVEGRANRADRAHMTPAPPPS
ncbi:ABC transporter ATP-binding protein [Streptomyces sp. CRN 30]|uniref:ABC transporter ATP-binding protein n=1 Tax=Streptomyces sp. CRN 30 TaxID=3075613 RepID=UPI002A82C976|nr:ABC transporter ATP-binding protein [Streptomyces sp. CRN 30]